MVNAVSFKGDTWAIDFDDFIYKLKFPKDPIDMNILPIKSTVDFINKAFAYVEIIIYTARGPQDISNIKSYLKLHKIKFHKVVSGKFSANRYFGDNYFNSFRGIKLVKSVSDNQQTNLLKTIRTYKEDIYDILTDIQESSQLAKLFSHCQSLNTLGKFCKFYIAGEGTLNGYAQQFATELKYKVKNETILFTDGICLGINSANASYVSANTSPYDNLRFEFINSIRLLHTKEVPILIVFLHSPEDESLKHLILEATTVNNCKVFIFTGDFPKVKKLYSGIRDVNIIVINSVDEYYIKSVYPIIGYSLIDLFNKYFSGTGYNSKHEGESDA